MGHDAKIKWEKKSWEEKEGGGKGEIVFCSPQFLMFVGVRQEKAEKKGSDSEALVVTAVVLLNRMVSLALLEPPIGTALWRNPFVPWTQKDSGTGRRRRRRRKQHCFRPSKRSFLFAFFFLARFTDDSLLRLHRVINGWKKRKEKVGRKRDEGGKPY